MSDASIIHEYKTAIYEVYDPRIILRVGEVSPDFEKLLEQHEVETWAFITPYNPHPRKLSDAENQVRLEELQHRIESYITYAGEGRDDGATPCPIEKWVFILGIAPDEARALGNHFEQKAILIGKRSAPVELLVLR